MSVRSVLSSAQGAGYTEKEVQPLPLRSAVQGGWQLCSLSPGLLVLGSRSCGNAEGFTVPPRSSGDGPGGGFHPEKKCMEKKAPTGR